MMTQKIKIRRACSTAIEFIPLNIFLSSNPKTYLMKKLIFVFVISLLFSSCAGIGPAGTWNYTVTGTPQGDFTGDMIVDKNETGYAAKLSSKDGVIPFNTFTYDKKEKKSSGKFDFSGTTVDFNASVEKEQMKGTMTAGGMEFPFTATKEK